ncbi:type I methionyl aminopeptidase [Candidatus Berkelbacteria bacterium RBG_13_40_8]|uniref:Methionine aminopeptidase n=1 Tax=Candidatus Berkelbacteria bacterium RBG_13_40_8 TaxID=1797467 RepID=A0A1F5DQ91_9BACT|nr:MAG: type I methionyl aminopeptidase [Candidatus Berkelbacteria bacterium RBG_13_40_8]
MYEISIKTKEEIKIMRAGGKIAARVLENLKKVIKPGMTIKELDTLAEKEILKAGGIPSFKNHHKYPATTCISVNEEVVHGIPTNRIIKKGDLVGLDLGVYYRGYHSDTAITIGVGKITPEARKLRDVTEKALQRGIKAIKPELHLGDIQEIVQKTIENAGFGVIRDLSGHGIGKKLQESPSIPNFGKSGSGPVLKEGMTLAIEPMVSAGDWHVNVLKDGWTVVTADGSLAAHFEHTIAVTKNGAEILTKL